MGQHRKDGYCLLADPEVVHTTGMQWAGSNRADASRRVRIQLDPSTVQDRKVRVWVADDAGEVTDDDLKLTVDAPDKLLEAETFKFGFSSGAAPQGTREVRDVNVSSVDPLGAVSVLPVALNEACSLQLSDTPVQLRASFGVAPYTYSVNTRDAHGAPFVFHAGSSLTVTTAAGVYDFDITVTDSSVPPTSDTQRCRGELIAGASPLLFAEGGDRRTLSRVYDGTTTVALPDGFAIGLSGVPTGKSVAVALEAGAYGTFDDASAGPAKRVMISGASLTGTHAGEFQLSEPVVVLGEVTRRTLNAENIRVATRQVDETTDATLVTTSGSLAGVVSVGGQLDDVSLDLTGATASFADATIGIDKPVTVTGVGLTGADADNYRLGTVTATGTITMLPPVTVEGLRAVTRTADGTTVAQLDLDSFSLAGMASDDDVQLDLSGATAVFADAQAGDDKPVTVSGARLDGMHASSYVLAEPVLATGTILPAPAPRSSPTPDPDPSPEPAPIPPARPSEGGVGTVGGQPVQLTVESGASRARLAGDGFEVEVDTGRDESPQGSGTGPDDPNVILDLRRGEPATVTAAGLRSNSAVQVWLWSEPRLLGTFETSASGTLDTSSVPIPDDVEACAHRLQIIGTVPSGDELQLALDVRVTADPSPFADLPFGAIHADAAACLSDLGIVNGTGPVTFDPQAATTRGQVAAMLARALHLDVDDDADGELVFPDTVGTTHERAIAAVHAAGLVDGFDDGSFRPGLPVTRGQWATMLARALTTPDGDANTATSGTSPFTDTAGTTHADAIDRLHAHGIARGYTDRTYRPNAIITRAAFATTLDRALPDLQP